MKFKAVVLNKFDFCEDRFVYAEGRGCRVRVDEHEFLGKKLPNVGDEVEIEIRGRFWVRARTTHQFKTSWKKEGF